MESQLLTNLSSSGLTMGGLPVARLVGLVQLLHFSVIGFDELDGIGHGLYRQQNFLLDAEMSPVRLLLVKRKL